MPHQLTKLMIARQEGGEWEIIPIHSLVLDGVRWDARNGWTGAYPYSVEEIERNQAMAAQKDGVVSNEIPS